MLRCLFTFIHKKYSNRLVLKYNGENDETKPSVRTHSSFGQFSHSSHQKWLMSLVRNTTTHLRLLIWLQSNQSSNLLSLRVNNSGTNIIVRVWIDICQQIGSETLELRLNCSGFHCGLSTENFLSLLRSGAKWFPSGEKLLRRHDRWLEEFADEEWEVEVFVEVLEGSSAITKKRKMIIIKCLNDKLTWMWT